MPKSQTAESQSQAGTGQPSESGQGAAVAENMTVEGLGNFLNERYQSQAKTQGGSGGQGKETPPGNEETPPAPDESNSETDPNAGTADAESGDEEPTGQASDQGEDEGDDTETGDGASEGEGDDDGDDESEGEGEDESGEESQGQKGPAWFQKRLGKLTAQRNEAREKATQAEQRAEQAEQRAQEAEQQLETAQTPAPQPREPGALDSVENLQDLNQKIDEAWQIKAWAEQNPEGGTIKDKDGNDVEISPEKVRTIKLNAEQTIFRHAPERRTWLQARDQMEPAVKQEYPWWGDKNSPQYQQAQKMLRTLPELKRFPDYKMVLGDYIAKATERIQRRQAGNGKGSPATAGKPAAQAGAKGAGQAAAAKKPAKVATKPKSAPATKPAGGDDEVSQAQAQFEESGRTDDLAKRFAASRKKQYA